LSSQRLSPANLAPQLKERVNFRVIYDNAASQKQQKTAELGHDYRLEK